MKPAKPKSTALLPPEDVAVCNALHESATNHAEKARQEAEIACHYAVVLGLRLQALRAKCPHGGWEKLFPDGRSAAAKCDTVSHFNFTTRTAQRYIRAAEGALARNGLAAPVKKRLLALAHSPVQELSEAHHADLDKATQGGTLRQLYLDLGVIKGAAEEMTATGGKAKETRLPEGQVRRDILPAEVYGEVMDHFAALSCIAERGDLTILSRPQLEDVDTMCRAILDVTKKINREDG